MLAPASRLAPWFLLLAAPWAIAAEPQTEPATRTAEEPIEAARLLPSGTLAYLQVARPAELLERARQHPTGRRLAAHPGFAEALQAANSLQLKLALAYIEAQLGQPWLEATKQLSGEGIYLAFDADSRGAALLVQAPSPEMPGKALQLLTTLAREEARNKGEPDPVRQGSYREITGYQIGEMRMTAFGSWLLVANQRDLVRAILDRYQDGSGPSLADNPRFIAARQTRPAAADAWAFVDLERLRTIEPEHPAFRGKTPNPLAELLVGGLVHPPQHAPYLTASTELTEQAWSLTLSMPHDPSWIPESRQYYFGENLSGAAPATRSGEEVLLSVGMYRELGPMWLQASELYEENMVAQLAQAESTLSTLFSGKDFGEEVLGALGPELLLVVKRQPLPEDAPQPAIRLPAGALVVRLLRPEETRDEFRRIFQSLLGFLNIAGATNGQPQLDFAREDRDGITVVASNYLPNAAEREGSEARIHFNFSPSIAFAGPWMVLASRRELAWDLAEQLNSTEAAPTRPDANTAAELSFGPLRKLLEENRESLIAQNMLSKGHSREAAEKEIRAVLALFDLVNRAELELAVPQDQLQLSLRVHFEQP